METILGGAHFSCLLIVSVLILCSVHLAVADWYPNDEGDWSHGKSRQYRKSYGGWYDDWQRHGSDDNNGEDHLHNPYKKPQPSNPPSYSYSPPLKTASPPPPPPPPQYKRSPLPKASPPYLPSAPYKKSSPSPYKPPTPRHKQPPIANSPKPTPNFYKPPQPSPPPYNPTTPAPPSNWATQWLEPHNAARAEVGLPPMVWGNKVAKYAEWWANERKLYGNCQMQHSDGEYGENIFWGIGYDYGPRECVEAWVSEKKYYDYGSNSCAAGEQCGHYTQIVWRDSVNVGCARVQCDSGDIFMTCNYDPPGNWIGSKPY